MSLIRDPATITKVGRQMMTAGGDITYTKATLYGQDISHLTKDQLESLTSIGSPLMTVPVGISDKSVNGSATTIVLEATFQNSNLKADLPYTAVGFFAKKGDDEKLVLVGVADPGAYLVATPPDGIATDALDIKVAISIGDAASVTAVVDPAGSVTPATLNGAISKATHDLTAQINTKADDAATKKALDTKANKSDVTASLATKADSADVDSKIAGVNKSISDVSDTVKANKDATDQALATKADKTDVAKDIDTVNKSISSMSATITANQKATDTALDTKADKTTVNQELATKANSSDVDKKLDEKADKSSVDAKINAIDFSKIKFRKQYLTKSGIPSDKTWNATKNSDGSYTIDIYQDDWTAYKVASLLQAITTKADQSSLDATNKTVATKANSSDVYTKKQVDDAFSSRDATIATKADKATVDAEISKIDFTPYAKTADVNKEIKTVTDLANTKVDTTYSYSKAELDKKLLALSTDTSGKVDANQVATMIEGKADKTDLDNEIKAVTDLANTKANTVDVDSKIKTVTDLANTKANSADVYTKTETDNQINKFDLSKVKFRKQFLNSDGDKVDKTWSATKNDDGTYTIDLYNDDWTAAKLFDVICQLPNKADTSTVNAQIADVKNTIKSNVDNLQSDINTKANASDVYTKKQVDDAFSSRDATIANKADKATVDAEISKIDFTPYAKTADVNKEIKTVTDLANTKVDTTYSYSKAELDKKLLALSTDTSGKVDANQVATMIEGKADKTDLDNEIKAVTDLANTKANTVDVDSKIKTVTDLANTKANSADVYTKTETDNQINKFDLSKVKFRKQFLNSDGDKVDKTWSATKNDDGTYTIDLYNDDWTAAKLFDVICQLPNKADTSTVNAQIADVKNTIKSNVDNLQSDINTKANASDVYTKKQVDDAFSSRDATIANKADKSYVDDKVGAIDFSKIKFRKQYVTGNNKTADSTWQATKNADGTYTIDLYNDDWTAQRVVDLLNQIGSKANASDVNSLQNIINQQNQTIQSLTTRLTNAENEIRYIKANYVEGRTFPASQEAQANSWENENPQRIAFITK